MKLSKIYTNKDSIFEPIDFGSGFNVVLAEIRLPENLNKDTHNLGKSTLARIIDFGFLVKRNSNFFLFRHFELFKELVFYIEIELFDSSFVTLRRSVEKPSKISIKKHREALQNYSDLDDSEWDHVNLPFKTAVSMLDGILNWGSLKPWSFRHGLGYLLRSQEDYRDVFHLRKFIGSHSNWKPFLAHILGFNATLLASHYEKEVELGRKREEVSILETELGGSVEDASKIEGILLLKQEEADKKQTFLDAFDFRTEDEDYTKELVNEIDERIAILNSERYSLKKSKKKIQDSLTNEKILFDPDEAERLFDEAGVLFQGQIKKDFSQLINFNKAITEERQLYLQEELVEIEDTLMDINTELNIHGAKRSETLSFLSDTDVFNKYKQVSDEMVSTKADIKSLESQRGFLLKLQKLRADIRSLEEELGHLQTDIEIDVEEKNSNKKSQFSQIRLFFSEIVEEVINRKALLSVSPNQYGHLEFKAEILDESGNATSADLGQTYRKLLCIAFDLAILRVNIHEKSPRFVYLDGLFESLDNRKKENLLNVIRRYSDLGLQVIITLIDSDLPPTKNDGVSIFDDTEIILKLHDESEQGRLFKIPAW